MAEIVRDKSVGFIVGEGLLGIDWVLMDQAGRTIRDEI